MDYSQFITNVGSKKSRRAILLKGPSGSGKTFQFRTLHDAGMRGLYVCVDEHAETLSDLTFDRWNLTNVDVPLTPTEKDPNKQNFIALMDYLRSDLHEYDFVYFDSLMNFADELVQYLKYTRRLTGFELWLAFGEKMKRALKTLVSLAQPKYPRPLHVLATWGVEVSQDWEGKRAIVPIVDGKMVGPKIDYFFDDVLMLRKEQDFDTKEIRFVAYTGGTHEFEAKVSSATVKMPPVWLNPDLNRMLEKFGVKNVEEEGEDN